MVIPTTRLGEYMECSWKNIMRYNYSYSQKVGCTPIWVDYESISIGIYMPIIFLEDSHRMGDRWWAPTLWVSWSFVTVHSYGSHGSFVDDLPMLQMPIFHSNLGKLLYKLLRVPSSSACAMGFAVGWEKSPRNGVLNNARDDTLVIDVKINRIAWGPILGSMSWLVVAGVSIGTFSHICVIRNRAIEHWHMFQKETLPQRCANLKKRVCCHGCKRSQRCASLCYDHPKWFACFGHVCTPPTSKKRRGERCHRKSKHRSWGVGCDRRLFSFFLQATLW